MDTISAAEVCRRSGVTYRKLDHYVRLGLVTPASEVYGSGHARSFPPEAVVAVRVASALMSVRVEREVIQTAVGLVLDMPATRWLWVRGTSVGIVPGTAYLPLSVVDEPLDPLVVLDLLPIRQVDLTI